MPLLLFANMCPPGGRGSGLTLALGPCGRFRIVSMKAMRACIKRIDLVISFGERFHTDVPLDRAGHFLKI